ncbi:MAG: HU family DNA-binding protein [Legionellales bacterium]|nr:HU family DNA-binding protein [Legionellales bacterium]
MPRAAAKKAPSAKKGATRANAKNAVKRVPAKKAVKAEKAKAVEKKKVDMTKVKPLTEKLSKTQVIQFIAEQTGLPRADITEVFKGLALCVYGQMKKRGFGEVSIPETGIKVRRIRKPATKARKMLSPFTGEEIMVKAKPARNVVKVSALKALKESVKD